MLYESKFYYNNRNLVEIYRTKIFDKMYVNVNEQTNIIYQVRIWKEFC